MTSDGDWGGWDPDDWSSFWYRVKAIEQARFEGRDADATCREHGLADWDHMQRVRAAFVRRFGDQPGFTRAAAEANARHVREAIAKPVVAPCTLERYAEIGGAQLAWAQHGRDFVALLAERFGITPLEWAALAQYWATALAGDPQLGARYGELLVRYSEHYLAG